MESLPQFIFDVSGLPLLTAWIGLLIFPKTKFVKLVFKTTAFPLFFAVLYSIVIIPSLVTNPDLIAIIARPTLSGIQELLSTPYGASAAWMHFLCFDLLVGRFVWQRALDREHSFYWVSPLLFTVLMFAPLGWLTFESVSAAITLNKKIRYH